MGRVGRWLGVGVVLAAGGCGWLDRPLADDPLLRRGRGVWGDPAAPPTAAEPPAAPRPPGGPTIGAETP